jgi:hypothetical protein
VNAFDINCECVCPSMFIYIHTHTHTHTTHRFDLLPVFFKAFACNNRQLRQQLFAHIVHDIRRVNQKKKNMKLNNAMQNFMFRYAQSV